MFRKKTCPTGTCSPNTLRYKNTGGEIYTHCTTCWRKIPVVDGAPVLRYVDPMLCKSCRQGIMVPSTANIVIGDKTLCSCERCGNTMYIDLEEMTG